MKATALIFVGLICICGSLDIVEHTYSVKEGNVIGATFGLGLLETSFDQDLYITQTRGTCLDWGCATVAEAANACDYSDPRACQGLLPQCNSLAPICTELVNDTSAEWQRVYAGQEIEMVVPAGEARLFLFFTTNDTRCFMHHVQVRAEYGEPDVSVWTAATWGTGQDPLITLAARLGGEEVLICPKDFGMGTYVIQIYSYDSYFASTGTGGKFHLTIDSLPLRNATALTTCNLPASLKYDIYLPGYDQTQTGGHFCIHDGERRIYNTAAIFDSFWAMPVPKTGPCVTYAYHSNNYGSISANVMNSLPNLYYDSNILINVQLRNSKGVFTYCPSDYPGGGSGYIHFKIGTAIGPTTWFWVDSSPSAKFLRPFTDISPFQMAYDSYMSFQVACEGASELLQYYYRQAEGVWPVYPSLDPNAFFPRPYITFSIARFNNVQLSHLPALVPKKFAVAVLLSYRDLAPGVPDKVYMTPDQFKTCNLTLNGIVTNSSGEPFHVTITNFQQKPLDCDPVRYGEMKTATKATMDQLATANSIDLTNLRYSLDSSAFANDWVACQQLASSLFETQSELTPTIGRFCLLTTNDTGFAEDPCCNSSISWTGPNCVDRNVSIPTHIYSEATPLQSQICSNEACADLTLRDLESLRAELNSPVIGCSANTQDVTPFSETLLLPHRKCRDEHLGVDQTVGVPCWNDTDCQAGYQCDLLINSCKYPVTRQVFKYLECLLPLLDGYVVHHIEKSFGITPVQPSQRTLPAYINSWVSALSSQGCTGETSLGFPFRSHYWYTFADKDPDTICDHCPNVRCLDTYCTLPYECRSRFGTACYKSYRIAVSDPEECEQAEVCNWNPLITNATKCAQPTTAEYCGSRPGCTAPASSFCAYCESPDHNCAEFPQINATACAAGVGCVMANGDIYYASSTAQCEATGTCSVQCWDASINNFRDCDNETECLANGACEDTPLFDGDYNGLCVTETGPYRDPDCYHIPKILADGQVLYYDQIRPVPEGCLIYVWNETAKCTQKGGVMRRPATTEAQCTARGYGCTEPYMTYDYLVPEIQTKKSAQDCAAAGGTYAPLYKWTPGVWKRAISRPLQFVTRGMHSRNLSLVNTFDFYHFNTVLEDAIAAKYAYMLRSDSQCRYNRISEVVQSMACLCGGGANNQNETDTFNSICNPLLQTVDTEDSTSTADARFLQPIATTVVCPGFPEHIIAPPSRIFFSASSVSDLNCNEISISAASAISLRRNEEILASFLLSFEEQTEWQFRNYKRALVGQILSNGISLAFPSPLRDAELCITPRHDIALQSDTFTTLDFAKSSSGNSSLAPLLLSIAINDRGEYCGHLESVESEALYWVVLRRPDSESVDRQIFLPVEVGFYVMCMITYGIITVFCFQKIYLTVKYEPFSDSAIRNKFGMLIVVSLLALIRAVYVFLVVIGVFVDNNYSALSFVFIELPSFLYFTTMTFFIVVWGVALRSLAKAGSVNFKNTFRALFIAINAGMYLIFILLIILYQVLRGANTATCGGAIVSIDQETKKRISLAYRAIVAIIAAALTFAFLVFGTRFHLQMSHLKKVSNRRSKANRMLFVMTIICSVGIVLQTLFMLVLAITGYKNNILALCVLLAVEAFPSCFVLSVFTSSETKGLATAKTQHTTHNNVSSPASIKRR